jgi:hypothetical protein
VALGKKGPKTNFIHIVLFLVGDSPASEFCADASEHSVSPSQVGDGDGT